VDSPGLICRRSAVTNIGPVSWRNNKFTDERIGRQSPAGNHSSISHPDSQELDSTDRSPNGRAVLRQTTKLLRIPDQLRESEAHVVRYR
jgi:hypothetical protein